MRLCTSDRYENTPPVSALSASTGTVTTFALRRLFLLVFSLGNGIGIGFTSLTAKLNKCILDSAVSLPHFETVGKGSAECLPKVMHSDAVWRASWAGLAWLESGQTKLE